MKESTKVRLKSKWNKVKSSKLGNTASDKAKLIKKAYYDNKPKVLKEISNSKELVRLLAKSKVQKLTRDERHKVNTQLWSILKTIPSFAIFALPGGAVLLPLVLKMVPTLLPNSFRDPVEKKATISSWIVSKAEAKVKQKFNKTK